MISENKCFVTDSWSLDKEFQVEGWSVSNCNDYDMIGLMVAMLIVIDGIGKGIGNPKSVAVDFRSLN